MSKVVAILPSGKDLIQMVGSYYPLCHDLQMRAVQALGFVCMVSRSDFCNILVQITISVTLLFSVYYQISFCSF